MSNPWLEHVERWRGCQRCLLSQQRGEICLARGALPCDVLLVGEAPGMAEDAAGRPFVGPAGRVLDDIVARALPEEVRCAFTNLVACYPREAKERGDNEPERAEIMECRPRLVEFVNLAQPRLIVQVGQLALSYLNFDMTVPLVHIDHPAYIVRMPLAAQHGALQRAVVRLRCAWEDVAKEPREPWRPWGVQYAEGKTRRHSLRTEYDDDIPF